MEDRNKKLTIEIEYSRKSEMIKQLKLITDQIYKNIRNHDRVLKNNCITQWGIEYVSFNEFRVELINGKQCMIVKSKMNDL